MRGNEKSRPPGDDGRLRFSVTEFAHVCDDVVTTVDDLLGSWSFAGRMLLGRYIRNGLRGDSLHEPGRHQIPAALSSRSALSAERILIRGLVFERPAFADSVTASKNSRTHCSVVRLCPPA